jgi:hypothetical protein
MEYNSAPQKAQELNFKLSGRWHNCNGYISTYNLPLIDKLGKFSGYTLCKMKMTPAAFIATVTSTVLGRMKARCLRFNSRGLVSSNKRLLAKAAYYYSLTHNNWFHDRFLFLCKDLAKNKDSINSLVNRFLLHMDDNTRFVYSQVMFQTNWLFTRASWPRDKSIQSERSSRFRSLMERYGEVRYLQMRAFREVSVRMSRISPPYLASLLPHGKGW